MKPQPESIQDINKRILKKLIDEARDAWWAYYEASLILYGEGTFTEEDERVRIFDQLTLEQLRGIYSSSGTIFLPHSKLLGTNFLP